jgi:hypothetical protein
MRNQEGFSCDKRDTLMCSTYVRTCAHTGTIVGTYIMASTVLGNVSAPER